MDAFKRLESINVYLNIVFYSVSALTFSTQADVTPTALQSCFSFCNSSVFMGGGWDYCPVRQLHSCYQAMIQQTDDSSRYWCQNGCFCLYLKHNNWVFCGSWHFLVFKFFLWKFLTEGVRCPISHNKYYIAAVFWVICLWVQGGTVHTLKGKHPAIISTTSLDSNLSFLRQMRPLEQMDSYLIVLLWLYFSAFNDSCVYSLVELPPLLFFIWDPHEIVLLSQVWIVGED